MFIWLLVYSSIKCLVKLKRGKQLRSAGDLPFVGWSGFCKIKRTKWFASWITCFNNPLAWKIHSTRFSKYTREASQSLNEFLFSTTKFFSFVVNWRFHLRDLQANYLQGEFIGFSDFQRTCASGVIKRASGGCFLKKSLIAEDRFHDWCQQA